MGQRLALLPALALAGTVLTGCAGIIPAVAGETEPPSAAPAPDPVSPPAPQRAASPVDAAIAPAATQPEPASPAAGDPADFARFVGFVEAAARRAKGGAELSSAQLADPVALDGKRRRCAAGEQLVAVIDLDPAGERFAAPANPEKLPGLALGLQVLREAGVEITWMSDVAAERSGAVRTALEQSGLDPRGQDILSLRRDEADTKEQRRSSLGGFACIVAIAGDERTDFDIRFKYLRKPAAGAALEGLIGDGWFLVAPLIGK
ncbi:MAG: hypothetical protein ACKO01_05675 [Erythrobacter sp.]